MNSQLLIQLLVNGLVVGTLYGVVAMSFRADLQGHPGGEFRARRIAAGRRLGVLGAARPNIRCRSISACRSRWSFMFVFGIAIQIIILRPMIGEPIISVIMVTIALSTVFQAALKWMFGVNPQPFPRDLHQPVGAISLGLQIQTVYVMSLVVSVAMMIGMAWFFRVSKYGLAMRATAFNQQVAQSLGISVKSVFAMAWAISATVSAVAGVVVAVVNGVSVGPVGLRHQGVSGGDPRRPRLASAAPCSAASSSGCWKTSRNMSTANICTGAISTRSRRSTC